MSADKDITAQVGFGDNDGDCLPLTRCICGKRYQHWDFILHADREESKKCDCGRELYFRFTIQVLEKVQP